TEGGEEFPARYIESIWPTHRTLEKQRVVIFVDEGIEPALAQNDAHSTIPRHLQIEHITSLKADGYGRVLRQRRSGLLYHTRALVIGHRIRLPQSYAMIATKLSSGAACSRDPVTRKRSRASSGATPFVHTRHRRSGLTVTDV